RAAGRGRFHSNESSGTDAQVSAASTACEKAWRECCEPQWAAADSGNAAGKRHEASSGTASGTSDPENCPGRVQPAAAAGSHDRLLVQPFQYLLEQKCRPLAHNSLRNAYDPASRPREIQGPADGHRQESGDALLP